MITAPWWLGRVGLQFPPNDRRRRMPLVDIPLPEFATPAPAAPTRPAVVLDPFGGTGTVALVAAAFGRVGISVDRSADYCRLARWRVADPDEQARAAAVPRPPKQVEGQMPLWSDPEVPA